MAKGLKDWGIALDRQLPYRTVFRRGRAGIYQTEIRHVAGYSRVSFFKNFVARGSQRFVRQSSPKRGTRVQQPSVLNNFFLELQYSPVFGRESRKFAGGVSKYAKFRHFLANPVV